MQSLRPVGLYIIYVYEIHLQSYYFFLNKVIFPYSFLEETLYRRFLNPLLCHDDMSSLIMFRDCGICRNCLKIKYCFHSLTYL